MDEVLAPGCAEEARVHEREGVQTDVTTILMTRTGASACLLAGTGFQGRAASANRRLALLQGRTAPVVGITTSAGVGVALDDLNPIPRGTP